MSRLRRSTPKHRVFRGAFLAGLVLDQGSKLWIERKLPIGAQRAIVDGFFYLSHVRNSAGSFGLFAERSFVLRELLLVVVPVLVVWFIAFRFRRLRGHERLPALALGMTLGGVVGNLVDRVARGEVVDFLRFYLSRGLAWPDFNLADMLAVSGVGLLLVDLVRLSRPLSQAAAPLSKGSGPSPPTLPAPSSCGAGLLHQ